MYVCEGSHFGIVPMNHSNKDGTSSAESEEERLRIKENAGQSNTCPTQSGAACVSQGLTGVRTSSLYRLTGGQRRAERCGIRHTVTSDPSPSKSSAPQILFLIFLLIEGLRE